MNPPQSGTSLTEDAVQTIGGRNTRGDKSDSPGRRNEILELDLALSPKCFHFLPPAPGGQRVKPDRLPASWRCRCAPASFEQGRVAFRYDGAGGGGNRP